MVQKLSFDLAVSLPLFLLGQLASTLLPVASPLALGQDSTAPSAPDRQLRPAPKKKGPALPKRRPPGEPLATTTPIEAAAEPSPYFPPWGRREFDWNIGPLVGLRYEKYPSPLGSVQRTSSELGLRAGLSDISLWPGNPGLALSIEAGQAWGASATVLDAEDGRTTETDDYTRTLAGVKLTAYYQYVRQQLGYQRGRLAYSDKAHTLVQSSEIQHDLGLLVLSWLSVHHTYTYLRAFGATYGDPLLVQHDQWVHTRLFTQFLSLYLDMGPGFTRATEYGLDGAEAAKGQSEDLRFLTGMHLFWKFVAAGQAKYVYHASTEELGTLAGTRLPGEDLNQLSQVVLPEDSMNGMLFLGLRDILYGLSVGWQYNVEILHLSSKGDTKRETRESQGPVVGFVATF